MKRPVFLFSALACALGAQAQTYYGNGYTIVEKGTVDDRLSGLDAMVFKSIDAYSVQEGLEQLLQGSGWALAGADNADPQIWRLYRQPWPDNKRNINPMPLSQALEWVAGDGWSLVVDPVNRLVSFEVNSRYAARPAPVAATVANASAVPTDTVPPVSGTTRVSPTPYDPYGASVSYADSPSYNSSHGGSNSYVASPQALIVSPPDDSNSHAITVQPRKSVRDVTPLRSATSRPAAVKNSAPATATGKSGKTATEKSRRKAAGGTTAASPALLPADSGKASSSTKKAAPTAAAGATTPAADKKPSATPATDKQSPVTAATDKTTGTVSDAAKKSAASTDAAKKPAASPVATDSKSTDATAAKTAAEKTATTTSPATDSNGGEKQP